MLLIREVLLLREQHYRALSSTRPSPAPACTQAQEELNKYEAISGASLYIALKMGSAA